MRATKGKPNDIDAHIGEQLRAIRTQKNLSQEKLGAGVGVTFQQIQKYERGTNRIAASRLYQFSKFLSVPIPEFYRGLKHSQPLEKGNKKHGKK